MEITSSALTASLVGVIMALVKVIEWLMRRSNGHHKTKQAKDYNGLGEVLVKIDTKLDMLSTGLSEMRQGRAQLLEHMANADSSHERIVERIGDVVASVDRVADNVADLRDHIKRR